MNRQYFHWSCAFDPHSRPTVLPCKTSGKQNLITYSLSTFTDPRCRHRPASSYHILHEVPQAPRRNPNQDMGVYNAWPKKRCVEFTMAKGMKVVSPQAMAYATRLLRISFADQEALHVLQTKYTNTFIFADLSRDIITSPWSRMTMASVLSACQNKLLSFHLSKTLQLTRNTTIAVELLLLYNTLLKHGWWSCFIKFAITTP